MPIKESVLEKRCCSHVNGRGGLSIKLSNYLIGLPDRLFLMPHGKCFFVEFKTTTGSPSKLQLYFQKRLRALGFTSEIIDNEEDFVKLLNKVDLG